MIHCTSTCLPPRCNSLCLPTHCNPPLPPPSLLPPSPHSVIRVKSFSQQIKRVAVELFTEKRRADHMDLILNNALALALNSKSSECVQVWCGVVHTGWGCEVQCRDVSHSVG